MVAFYFLKIDRNNTWDNELKMKDEHLFESLRYSGHISNVMFLWVLKNNFLLIPIIRKNCKNGTP